MQVLTEAILKNADIPAFSLAWQQAGRRKSLASGLSDTLVQEPVNIQTLFQAASLSKPLSAAIVLKLVEKNLLELDRPLADIMDYGPPELKKDPHYRLLTARMIISQCSGLPNWFYPGEPIKFTGSPGGYFNYSGQAFDCLKEVIEKQSGKSWEILAQGFFRKAGMKNSTFKSLPGSHLHEKCKLAHAHQADGRPILERSESYEIPAASLLTTANDYLIFLQYCLKDDFLRSTLLSGKTALDPQGFPETPLAASQIQWGAGMGIFTDSEKCLAFHWGNNPGSDAFSVMDMKTGDVLVCLVNSVNGPNIFQAFSETLLGDMHPLFAWLSTYCNFKAEKAGNDPAALHQLFREINHSIDESQMRNAALMNNGIFASRPETILHQSHAHTPDIF